jgi:hypothetical protein
MPSVGTTVARPVSRRGYRLMFNCNGLMENERALREAVTANVNKSAAGVAHECQVSSDRLECGKLALAQFWRGQDDREKKPLSSRAPDPSGAGKPA